MIITDQAWPYLRIQQGMLWDLREDFEAWRKAYLERLEDAYHEMAPLLPDQCTRIIDVGGGMGGIDIFLARHYRDRGQNPEICIVDGLFGKPEVQAHDCPFSSSDAAQSLLVANEFTNYRFVSPMEVCPPRTAAFEAEIVISMAAWCFHFAPDWYLDFVKRCNPRFVMIEVRKARSDWLKKLQDWRGFPIVLSEGAKYSRNVYGFSK